MWRNKFSPLRADSHLEGRQILDDRFASIHLNLFLPLGLRTGDAPDVAAIVQEKFDMELEMAKTLIQQECEETIESEQVKELVVTHSCTSCNSLILKLPIEPSWCE